jgi:dsRNA-specific ribonuclease
MDITADFIKNVFSKSKIDPKYMNVLTNSSALDTYNIAFTSKTVHPEDNYELFEFLGDTAANDAIVMYFYEVFPQLRCAKSINILNRLKIVYVSRDSFSKIAENLGFWPYIKYDKNNENEYTKKTKEALLEDVFEAFIGATKIILLKEFNLVGVGSQIIYNFIKPIFDAKNISFKPEDIFDAKTRLKELFDNKSDSNLLYVNFGQYKYNDQQHGTNTELHFPKVKLVFNGSGNSKQQSHKIAAQKAIDYFNKKGYKTEKKFNLFCK